MTVFPRVWTALKVAHGMARPGPIFGPVEMSKLGNKRQGWSETGRESERTIGEGEPLHRRRAGAGCSRRALPTKQFIIHMAGGEA